MVRNFFIVAIRRLFRNPGYSFINIAGLAVGMAVSMLIGLWTYDEIYFNSYHQNYRTIAGIFQTQTANAQIKTLPACPFPMAEELRNNYKSDFKHVVAAWWEESHTLDAGEKRILQNGTFMDPEGLEMFSFNMLKGSWKSLDDPASIVLSESTAKAMFGCEDPINKMIRIDTRLDVRVTGVYEDIPFNSQFHAVKFVGSWTYWVEHNPWLKINERDWNYNISVFAEIDPSTSFDAINTKIHNIKSTKVTAEQASREKPEIFLEPMTRWHLYSEFKDGKAVGGRIEFVWLFSAIGIFVLLLACINFMNLSTAQSERRAREVGIRKTIGSARLQLVNQFLSESLLVVIFAYAVALVLVTASLPAFNLLAAKDLHWPLTNIYFWLISIAFVLITSLLAGSYPALYLSSFQPLKAMKGKFRVGRSGTLPRQVLVVLQFTVSIVLIIGTVIVWQQVQFAKNRPIGYSREGLIMIRKSYAPELWRQADVLARELKASDGIAQLAEASNPATDIWFNEKGFDWKEKDPNLEEEFTTMAVTHDYGKTVGWTFTKGRDFSREHSLDSSAIVLNESAVKYMGLVDPINEEVRWNGKLYHVIGVIQDMVMGSPFEPVKQTIFTLDYSKGYVIVIRLNPRLAASESLNRIDKVFHKLMPSVPFDFEFIDVSYALKFSSEERVGRLASLFAALAIFISCLGLFGMASFVAEQRRKEIGIRKVLGASVIGLWKMLSTEFLLLVALACLLGIPVAWHYLELWLKGYSYRITVSPWVFVFTSTAALLITLLTVSFQTLRASSMNPVKSIGSE